MTPPQEPPLTRPFAGRNETPPRCHMESLFSSIMQSAVLEEVSAQKSEPEPSQTEEAPSHKQAESKGNRRAFFSRSSSNPTPKKHGKRSRDSKSPKAKTPRSGRSKRADLATVKSEEDETKDKANQFIPDYSGYNTMDAELKSIRQELLKREHE